MSVFFIADYLQLQFFLLQSHFLPSHDLFKPEQFLHCDFSFLGIVIFYPFGYLICYKACPDKYILHNPTTKRHMHLSLFLLL